MSKNAGWWSLGVSTFIFAAEKLAAGAAPELVVAGGVASAVGGLLVNRASGQLDSRERQGLAARNHHLRRAMAVAVRRALNQAPREIHGATSDLFTHWDYVLQEAETDNRALERRFPGEFTEAHWEATNSYSPNSDKDARALADLLLDLTAGTRFYKEWTGDQAFEFSRQVLPGYRQAFSDYIASSEGLSFQAFVMKALQQLLARPEASPVDPAPAPDPPTDRDSLPPITALRGPHRMPFRSIGDLFVGRVDALWTVYEQLSQGKTSIVQGVGVVYGTGGLGKTQLAVEYVHRFNLYYPGGVFWIEADQGLSRLIAILSGFAGIEVDGRLPERDQLEIVWAALARRPATLLVLDNFPETGALRPWLPTSGDIHVLVTTRRRDLTGHSRLTLPFLTPEEGQRLLNRFDNDARALVEDVGGLPLALEILRAYLASGPVAGPAELRRAMRETGAVLLLERFAAEYSQELPTNHERSVAATFQLSWNLAGEDAKDLLLVMSQLAPVPVPLRLLRATLGWTESTPLDDRATAAIRELVRLSLVESDEQGQPSAHRLVLGFVRYLGDGDSRWTDTVTAVEKEMNRSSDDADTASYVELESVTPHAEAVLSRPDLPPERAAEIAGSLGWHNKTLGRFQPALLNTRAAVKHAERIYSEGDPTIATHQSNLAGVLQDLGELPEARNLVRNALAAAERSYPPGHPEIAAKQSNLASVLQDLGELLEARDLLRKALASDERSFPPGHPNIAIGQSNLAIVLMGLGELPEARDLLPKALASDERSFPPGHPKIAIDQSNLALVLQGLGELREARDLLRDALAADERSYPPGHPSIAIDQTNLALVLKALGELPEARALAQKAYDSFLAKFGPDHPHTRTSKANLDSLAAAP